MHHIRISDRFVPRDDKKTELALVRRPARSREKFVSIGEEFMMRNSEIASFLAMTKTP